jgi:hypothetical protein
MFDVVRGKTKPHAFTWFPTALTAFIAFGLQLEGGAGIGAWPMFVMVFICFAVFLLSLWRGTRDITISDGIMLVISLLALYLWLVVKQPLLSLFLITFSEIMSFGPTIRKSWKDPYSETITLYQVSTVRHALSIVALEKINLLTALYPVAWTLTNLFIAIFLFIRRKQIPRTASKK